MGKIIIDNYYSRVYCQCMAMRSLEIPFFGHRFVDVSSKFVKPVPVVVEAQNSAPNPALERHKALLKGLQDGTLRTDTIGIIYDHNAVKQPVTDSSRGTIIDRSVGIVGNSLNRVKETVMKPVQNTIVNFRDWEHSSRF